MAAAPSLPEIPLEVQVDIFTHLHALSPASFASALRLSQAHYRILSPLLYRSICARSRLALEGLASTLICHPELSRHARSFFFQGPQGRRTTGRDQLRLLVDAESEEDMDEEGSEAEEVAAHHNDLHRSGLEAGIEGEGQEATWDEHESLMHLCTLILRLCAEHLESIGFVDCVPWFLAPTEGGALSFPLPRCKDFTGVTVGLFGLLPHLQRSDKMGRSSGAIDLTRPTTSLQRIHLIGGDFGSFALQRVLFASPTYHTLTHLHITAPTLYRAEHHAHLVKHIAGLISNTPNLKRISVGFLHWFPAPPYQRKDRNGNGRTTMVYDELGVGTGDDSFERGQLKERSAMTGFGPTEYDDRLAQCRQAYFRALPAALQQSGRENVTASIVRLPFVEGTPVGFAGWILAHHSLHDGIRDQKPTSEEALRIWAQRDSSDLPAGVAKDGVPEQSIWQTEPTIEWAFDGELVQLIRGNDSEWV